MLTVSPRTSQVLDFRHLHQQYCVLRGLGFGQAPLGLEMASFSFAAMDYGRQEPLASFSSPAAFVGVLQATSQRWPYRDHRRPRKRNATLLLSSSSKSGRGTSRSTSNGGSRSDNSTVGEAQHSEQRPGFRPPAPLEEDGHVVDLLSLVDLFDSGEHAGTTVYLYIRTLYIFILYLNGRYI